MNLTRLALDNYIAALVAVFMVILFGTISLSRLPVQLTPEVEKPTISVRTSWRAAAPEEIESEIIEPQEKVLRGLFRRRSGASVFRILDDNTAERITVVTGIADGDWIAVSGGISPGDRIVVRGGERLNAGDSVSISPLDSNE